jgi:inosine-uridine nucleoside N-ribohydrolase
MALPLILDTDIGLDVDDAIALCFAALEPRIELRAVTTVNGDTQQRASVARALLRLCGREDVPVGAGASLPLDGRAHASMPVAHVDTDPVRGLVDETHPSARDVLAAALESARPDRPVTIAACLGDDDRAAIAGAGRLGRALSVLMENFIALLAGFMPGVKPEVRLHDPLSAAALVHPELAGFEAARLSVLGGPAPCRLVESPHGRPIDACRSVDAKALAALMVRTLDARP